MSDLRKATSRRIKDSDKRKQEASDRMENKRQKRRRVLLDHTIPSYLLATIIVANWDKLKDIRRKQEFLFSLAPLIEEVSPTLGNMVNEIDPEDAGNPIYQFLTKHGFHYFKRGALSAEER